MSSQILNVVSREPPLLRWLHSHDPDRDLSTDLLKSSATYVTSVPPPDDPSVSDLPPPPTSSLFVPMYRRKHFILGQLYGPMSPNAMALNMLSQAGYGSPPEPISRRFVVDLSFPQSLQFIEYEWLSDGKLCVSMHEVTDSGLYAGESILLESHCNSDEPVVLSKNELLSSSKTKRPSPSKVIMRLKISEQTKCESCSQCGIDCCSCPAQKAVPAHFEQSSDWESWVSAFARSRAKYVNVTISFSMVTAKGNVEGSKRVPLRQECEMGVGANSPRGSQLLRMFMQTTGMLLSHPTTDAPVCASTERQNRIAFANTLSEEEEWWASPQVVTLGTHAAELHPTSIVPSSSRMRDSQLYHGAWHESSASTSSRMALANINCVEDTSNAPGSSGMPDLFQSHTVCLQSAGNQPESQGYQSQGILNTENELSQNQRLTYKLLSSTKKKAKRSTNLFVCECGKVFSHKGHYNEHRLCVHEKVREHKCGFAYCQSRFFKKSDRDRHMRSKHGYVAVTCRKCNVKLPSKDQLEKHNQTAHPQPGILSCSYCSLKYRSPDELQTHLQGCHSVT